MTTRNFSNVVTVGTLTGPVSSSGTSLTLSNFSQAPAVPFTATLDRNTATEEIVLVTALLSNTATVTRGYDGTAAQTHAAGAAFEHTAGAIEYNEANHHVNATANVHGVTGNLVGDQGSQNIYDKTLVSPVLQANVTSGDAAVAYIPPGAETKNLFTGIGSDGATKFSVSSGGALQAQSVQSVGMTTATGGLSVGGASTLTGAASLNGGATVPAGKTLTVSGTLAGGAPATLGATTTSTLHATGAATLDSTLQVTGNITGSGTLTTTGNAAIGGSGTIATQGTTVDAVVRKDYVDARVNAPDAGWTTATYQNSWVDYGSAGWIGARYRKLSNGQVEIQGMVKGGTGGSNVAVFTLPVGYRPLSNQTFPTLSNNVLARVDVQADGKVCVVIGASSIYNSLNCTFYAEA